MASINGLVYPPYCRESQPSNANKDGMSGWIPASKKPSGVEPKMKNYFNLQEFFPASGELLLLLLAEPQHNVFKDTRSYWI